MELPGQPVARMKWSFLEWIGEVSGDDERAVARSGEHVEGCENSNLTSDGFELEVQLVDLV